MNIKGYVSNLIQIYGHHNTFTAIAKSVLIVSKKIVYIDEFITQKCQYF